MKNWTRIIGIISCLAFAFLGLSCTSIKNVGQPGAISDSDMVMSRNLSAQSKADNLVAIGGAVEANYGKTRVVRVLKNCSSHNVCVDIFFNPGHTKQEFNQIEFPDNITHLNIYGHNNLSGYKFPHVSRDIFVNGLLTTKGLIFDGPTDRIIFSDVREVVEFVPPKRSVVIIRAAILDVLDFSGVHMAVLKLFGTTEIKKCIFPDSLYSLYLPNLKRCEGFTIPEKVERVFFGGIESLVGLDFPDSIGYVGITDSVKDHDFSNLESVEVLRIDNFESYEDIILPLAVRRLILNGEAPIVGLGFPEDRTPNSEWDTPFTVEVTVNTLSALKGLSAYEDKDGLPEIDHPNISKISIQRSCSHWF